MSLMRRSKAAMSKHTSANHNVAGQEVEVDLEKDILTDIASGKQYPLKSIGEVCHPCMSSTQTGRQT